MRHRLCSDSAESEVLTVKSLILVVLAILAGMTVAPALAQKPVTVGEHVKQSFATPHPYPAGDGETQRLVWSDQIFHPGAVYIAPHFARFQLAPGDRVIIRSPDGAQSWTYTGLGKADLGLTEDGFFAVHLKGDTAIVELWAVSPEPGWGYEIDLYGRGYDMDEIRAFWDAGLGEQMNLPEPTDFTRSICTANDSEEAKCYQASEPAIYDRGRAVVRLLQSGASHCTGWLVGCDGHVMTNEHCIGSQSQLDNIDFEWMAEGAICETNCMSSLACPGTIEASGGTMVQFDAPLDYALVLPDTSVGGGTDLNATYGFLQLRDTGAVVGEQMYIMHHPAGWGKHFSFRSTYPLEPNPPFASVISITESACSAGGPPDVGYWADTQGGSSGSAVMGYADHKVIALHHCRGSGFCDDGASPPDDPNRGVPIQDVIADLGANLPSCAACDPPDDPTGLTATPNGANQIDLSWTASAGADSYNVYRAIGSCPRTGYQLIASGIAGTAYSDTGVSGGTTYAYVVRAFDETEGCESFDSNCDDAEATGLCTVAPEFAGLESVTNAGTASCAIDLAWSAAAASCGSNVVYNVWRSETPDFDPGATTPLATCVGGTSYQDTSADFNVEYFYQVRAEDDSGNGAGPCAGGNQDGNTEELSGTAAGPETEIFADDIESGGGNWATSAGPADTGTAPWSIVDTAANSPTHSWFVADEAVVKDQYLDTIAPIAVGPAAMLSFWHSFDTENSFDGGVLEYSTDGGTTWFDILDGDGAGVPANAGRFLTNGYTGAISTSFSSPIGGRQAWEGDGGGFVETTVDLADFGGETVHFRWRLACDTSVSGNGWWVDDARVFSGSECDSGCTTNAECDDGLFCNGSEICDSGLCQAGNDPCDDGVSCTVDSCDEATDTCDGAADDSVCDNGLFCDGAETCDPALDCQAGTPPICDDGVSCTDDTCDESTDSCSNVDNCDDGVFCDGVETCDAVLGCQAGVPACDDGVSCTIDSCDEAADSCDNVADDGRCDNGSYCDGEETCDPALDCQAGPPVDCDDGVDCTDDSCDEGADACDSVPNDANCDDGIFCDGVETCDAAIGCQAGSDPCDDGIGCSDDSCDEAADSCDHIPNDSLCDNGLFCDGVETCDVVLDCQAGTDPCPSQTQACDEPTDMCVDAIFVDGFESGDTSMWNF